MTEWVVYVIGAGDGPFKIGLSRDVNKRLAMLNHGGPIAYQLLFIAPVASRDDAFTVENVAHRLLREHRLRGEWFNILEKDAKDAILRAVEHVRSGGDLATLWPKRPYSFGHNQTKGGTLLTRYKNGSRTPECIEGYRAYMREAQRRRRERQRHPEMGLPIPTQTIIPTDMASDFVSSAVARRTRGHTQVKGGTPLSRYKYRGDRDPEAVQAYRDYMREATRRLRKRRKEEAAQLAEELRRMTS